MSLALGVAMPALAQDTLVLGDRPWSGGATSAGVEVNLDVLTLAPPPRPAPDLLPPPEGLPPRSSNLARFRPAAGFAAAEDGLGGAPDAEAPRQQETASLPPAALPAAPAPAQMAALPPAALPPPKAAGERLRLAFAPGSTALDAAVAAELDAAAGRLGPDAGRVQILAYATPTDASASSARRLALKRALAVRGHLVARGIAHERIDVRALGDSAGALDAVDIVTAP